MEFKKKIIFVIAGAIVLYGLGFGTNFLITKLSYTRAADRIESALGDGYDSSRDLYSQLEQRLRELEEIQGKFSTIEVSINECSNIVEQSGNTIGQLGNSVEELAASATDIRELIKQLKSGQREIAVYVSQLEQNNQRLESELGRLQKSVSQQ